MHSILLSTRMVVVAVDGVDERRGQGEAGGGGMKGGLIKGRGGERRKGGVASGN